MSRDPAVWAVIVPLLYTLVKFYFDVARLFFRLLARLTRLAPPQRAGYPPPVPERLRMAGDPPRFSVGDEIGTFG